MLSSRIRRAAVPWANHFKRPRQAVLLQGAGCGEHDANTQAADEPGVPAPGARRAAITLILPCKA